MRRIAVAALALAVAPAAATACGGDAATAPPAADGGTVATPAGTTEDGAVVDGALPPQDLADVAAVYDPILKPFGVHLTRAALIDLGDGGYAPSPDGRHLALYVAPNEPFTDEQYAAHVAPLAATLTSDVFTRYPGLVSYDVCQEGPDLDGDPATLPPTKSQLNVERAALDALDWADVTLPELLAFVARNNSVRLSAAIELRRTTPFVEAQQSTGPASGDTGTTAVPGPSRLPASTSSSTASTVAPVPSNPPTP